MKNIHQRSGIATVIVALACWICPAITNASGILYQFDTPFPTDPNPTASGPWIDASFIDVTPGTVLLTVTNVNLASGEFVQGNGNGASGGLYFNLNPNDDPTSLAFSLVSSNGSFSPIISTGEDKFKADGDGKYDIQFDFASHNFVNGSSITYQITGIAGLTSADFEYESLPAGGSGPFYAAAHVQGLPPNGSNSTWIEPGNGPIEIISVPEPSLMTICTMIIILSGTSRLWLRRNKTQPLPVCSRKRFWRA